MINCNNMRTIQEQMYYSEHVVGEGELHFPHSSKAYLEIACMEWEQMPDENKVLDLGYLVTHGFDLRKYVAEYLADRPQNKQYILKAFVHHISYLRDPEEHEDYGMLIVSLKDKISVSEAVDLFCKEVTLRYEQHYECEPGSLERRLVQQLKNLPKWDYKALADMKLAKKQYYALFKLPTDEYLLKVK